MGIFTWIGLGLVAGIVAKLLMPGKQGGSIFTTTLLGVAGAFIGGFAGTKMGWGELTGFDVRSFGLATGGALALLIAFRLVRKK